MLYREVCQIGKFISRPILYIKCFCFKQWTISLNTLKRNRCTSHRSQMQSSVRLLSSDFLSRYLELNFFKWINPGLFSFIFSLFQTSNTILTTNQCKKCPSSIQCQGLNPPRHKHESSLKTTRLGLLP